MTNMKQHAEDSKSQPELELTPGDSVEASSTIPPSRKRRSSRSKSSRKSTAAGSGKSGDKSSAPELEEVGISGAAVGMWAVVFLVQVPGIYLYLQRVQADATYQLLPVACIVLTFALAAFRWDRNLRLPDSSFNLVLLGLGIGAAGVAATGGWIWFSCIGFVLITGAFLGSNCSRGQQSLLSTWCAVFGVLSLPLGFNDKLLLRAYDLIRDGSLLLLKWLNVPHVDYSEALSLVANRIYVADQLQNLLSWPLFFASAMVYSAIMKRGPMVVVFNGVFSFFCFILFHCLLIVGVGYFGLANAPVWSNLWLTSSVSLFILLVFLSAERGFRCMLAPIAEDFGGSQQINPVVAGWNYVQGYDSYHQVNRLADRRSSANSLAFPIAIGFAVLLIVSQAFMVPRAWASFNAERQSVAPQGLDRDKLQRILPSKSAADFRRVNRSVLPSLGSTADAWSTYLPTRTTRFSLSYAFGTAFNPIQSYAAEGWAQADSAQQPADGAVKAIRMIRDGAQAQLQWMFVSEKGQLFNRIPSKEELESDRLFVLQCFAVFVEEPSLEAQGEVQGEFLEFCSAAASYMASEFKNKEEKL